MIYEVDIHEYNTINNQRTEGPESCQDKFLADALLNEVMSHYLFIYKFANLFVRINGPSEIRNFRKLTIDFWLFETWKNRQNQPISG